MQTFPTLTESGGHLSVPALAGATRVIQTKTATCPTARAIRFIACPFWASSPKTSGLVNVTVVDPGGARRSNETLMKTRPRHFVVGSTKRCASRFDQLFRADNRATIHFVRFLERDVTCGSSRQDLVVGTELAGQRPREMNEDLVPQGIETVTLDRIYHGEEILFLVQVVRSIDVVDARVHREERGGGGVRQFFHVDGE